MTRTTRQRMRIAFVVIACLLFQQVALAAYACTLVQPPPDPMAMSGHCADMDMAPRKSTSALCEKHCAPDHSVATDRVVPTVPALALPPVLFAPLAVQHGSHVSLAGDVPVNHSDPPPRLRYCSLLI